MIHEAEATSALSLLTSNSLKAVADLLTVLSQALSRKPWPFGAGKKKFRERARDGFLLIVLEPMRGIRKHRKLASFAIAQAQFREISRKSAVQRAPQNPRGNFNDGIAGTCRGPQGAVPVDHGSGRAGLTPCWSDHVQAPCNWSANSSIGTGYAFDDACSSSNGKFGFNIGRPWLSSSCRRRGARGVTRTASNRHRFNLPARRDSAPWAIYSGD